MHLLGVRLSRSLLLLQLSLSLLKDALGAGSVPSTGRELPNNQLYSREYRWAMFSDMDTRAFDFRQEQAPKKLIEDFPKKTGVAQKTEEAKTAKATARETNLKKKIYASANPATFHKLKMYAQRGVHEVIMNKEPILKGMGAAAAALTLKAALSHLINSLGSGDNLAPPSQPVSTPGLQIGGMGGTGTFQYSTGAGDASHSSKTLEGESPSVSVTTANAVAEGDTASELRDGLAFVGVPCFSRAGRVWSRRFQTAVSRSVKRLPTAASSLSPRVGMGHERASVMMRSVCGRHVGCLRMSAESEEVAQPAGFETFFAGLFKKIGASPEDMGMKRFDRSKFPELYPATLDEWADLLPTDLTWQEQAIRPMLARTSMQERQLKLAFDAEEHGWDALEFHRRCDKMGPGVVIARTAGGAICGGYNPKGWVGLGEYRGSIASFLFTWPDGDVSKRPIKLRKVGGSSLACVDMPETGPQFGADGLFVPLQGSTTARCKLGPYFEKRPDGSNSIFADSEKISSTQLIELKVYVGMYEDGEEIPYNDALPFQLE